MTINIPSKSPGHPSVRNQSGIRPTLSEAARAAGIIPSISSQAVTEGQLQNLNKHIRNFIF